MMYDATIKELSQFLQNKQTRNNILEHKYGVGGLHWCAGPGLYHDVIDIDAKSFYPHILLNWRLLPDWIPVDKYEELLDRRMSGDKDERLKMALNVPTGKLRAESASVEDKERGVAMCLIGQILISVLREKLEALGYRTVQVNTDGIMIQNRGRSYMTAIKEWTSMFNIPVSIKDISHLEQADVNNYRAYYLDGTVKSKGAKFKK